MAQKPRKNVIQNIIKNLVDSEIPGIQAVVKELSEWTRQLEEHSWKIQHYASEIEEVTSEEELEAPEEASLADLVKNLEKTLAQLRQKPEGKAAGSAPAKAKSAKAKPSAAASAKAKPVETAPEDEAVEEVKPAAEEEAAPVETVAEKTEALEEEPVEPVPEATGRGGAGRPRIRDTFGLRGLRQTIPYTEPAPKGEESREEPEEDTETYITPEGFIVKRARK